MRERERERERERMRHCSFGVCKMASVGSTVVKPSFNNSNSKGSNLATSIEKNNKAKIKSLAAK